MTNNAQILDKNKPDFDSLVLMQTKLNAFLAPFGTIHGFKIMAHKVELSLFDHETTPRLQLYVLIDIEGDRFHCHTRRQDFQDAIEELSDWLQAVLVGEEML